MQNTSLCSVVSIAPQISVIMAVRNCAPYLAESIDSILNQTFEDFEFIIVDDSSTDATPQILADYAARDARIRILRNEQNLKLAASLNIALRVVRAPLIARMDGDDWSYPERLEKQYAFMKTNSQVTVCGTWLACYETGELWKRPIAHSDISAQMLFNSSIVHPSVMGQKRIARGGNSPWRYVQMANKQFVRIGGQAGIQKACGILVGNEHLKVLMTLGAQTVQQPFQWGFAPDGGDGKGCLHAADGLGFSLRLLAPQLARCQARMRKGRNVTMFCNTVLAAAGFTADMLKYARQYPRLC